MHPIHEEWPVWRHGSLAGVAQLVEHLFCKQAVAGSSPFASSFENPRKIGGLPERPMGAGCKPVDLGLRWFESITLHQFGPSDAVSGSFAGVAQLARALAFQAKGRGFESRFPLHCWTVGALYT